MSSQNRKQRRTGQALQRQDHTVIHPVRTAAPAVKPVTRSVDDTGRLQQPSEQPAEWGSAEGDDQQWPAPDTTYAVEDDDDQDEDSDPDTQPAWDDEDQDVDPEAPEEYTASSYLAGQRILLPSGKAIKVRPFSLMSAIERGALPNHLLVAARELLYGENDKIAKIERQRLERQNKKKGSDTEMMQWLFCQMVASFRVVNKPQSQCDHGEVSISNILECDLLAVVEFAMKGQSALTTFRQV